MNLTSPTNASEFLQKINGILDQCSFYSCVIIINICILCNILNLLISFKEKIRKEIIGFYNIALSSWNIVSLVFGFLLYCPFITFDGQNILLLSNLSCALINFMTRVSSQMTAWRYVCLTVDRYLCVAFNNNLYHIFNNRKKLSLIFLALFAFISLINVPNLLSYLDLDAEYNIICTSSTLINLFRNVEVSIFRFILPTMLQVVFSALLIVKLFEVRRAVVNNSNRSMKKEYRFARTILWVNLVYFITETPYCLMTIYFGVIGITPSFPLTSDVSNELAVLSLAYYASVVFGSYLFGSLLFINLSTNKLFQREIRIILRPRRIFGWSLDSLRG